MKPALVLALSAFAFLSLRALAASLLQARKQPVAALEHEPGRTAHSSYRHNLA